MELKITSNKGLFTLVGTLDKRNVSSFSEEVSSAFKLFDQLTINIDALEIIDSDGVKGLKNLYDIALASHKELVIVGTGCKELYDHFRTFDAA